MNKHRALFSGHQLRPAGTVSGCPQNTTSASFTLAACPAARITDAVVIEGSVQRLPPNEPDGELGGLAADARMLASRCAVSGSLVSSTRQQAVNSGASFMVKGSHSGLATPRLTGRDAAARALSS
mmetsp:Transcript_14230/g.41491  ORF Transcript_14230/g.41491 Transcript_14230/m.41491 type:complete len:125 (+) Transcript_14230:1460-1834(+)